MDRSPAARFAPLPLSSAEITGGFWAQKRELVWRVTLPAEWEQLEKNRHVDNFRVAAGVKPGVHLGMVFFDSDLYKWLEAANYALGKHPEDQALAGRVSELTSLFQAAQRPDGYLNTYYQSFGEGRRFKILLYNHELYCAGHLIEAAAANHESRGGTDLLEVGKKYADFIAGEFGPGKNQWFDGHEEIELALIRLYRETGDKKYLDRAAFFLHRRGRNHPFAPELIKEGREQTALAKIAREKRAAFLPEEKSGAELGFSFGNPIALLRSTSSFLTGRYFQADRPLEEYTVAEGHAVRAMYYFTGAADLYLETGDPQILKTLSTIWDNTISRRTYITGGMGSVAMTEGFGRDYELPNRSYTETCAAAGSIFWNWRMLMATGEVRYADQLERTLYNGFLSGLAQDGKHFFYQNPLASFGKDQRKEWYQVACCPPNIARLISSVERYLYGENADAIWVHQYMTGTARFTRPEGEVRLEVESGLPWDGKVKIKVQPEKPMVFTLILRVPGWAGQATVAVNGSPLEVQAEGGGYLSILLRWEAGEVVELEFPMDIRLTRSPDQVWNNRGKVALMRGPLVYCLEDKDNPGVDVHSAVIINHQDLKAEFRGDLLGGITVITGPLSTGARFTAIPYFAWSNRGPSHMEVWVKTLSSQ